MKKSMIQISTVGLVAILGLSACGGGSSEGTSDGGATPSSATDVTVERGKVFGARVQDASTPAQVAVSTLNSNVYRFAKTPAYPITVSGGYIDVDNDGAITATDIALDMNMSSYSNTITPTTTYLAQESDATLRQERLNGLVTMLQELDANSTVTADDLLQLPSVAKDEAVLVANAIFAKYEHVGDSFSSVTKTSIKSQYQSLVTLLSQSNIAPGDSDFAHLVEVAVMTDLKSNSYVNNLTTELIAEYTGNYGNNDNNTTEPSSGGDTPNTSTDAFLATVQTLYIRNNAISVSNPLSMQLYNFEGNRHCTDYGFSNLYEETTDFDNHPIKNYLTSDGQRLCSETDYQTGEINYALYNE